MGCGQSKPNEDATKGKGRQQNAQSGKKRGQVQRQPIHEKGWKKRIRENMRNAAAGDDIEHLEKCMQHFVNNHLDDGGDLTDAQRRMDFLLMRKEIRDACMRNHPEVLDRAIMKVESSTYRNRLKPYLDKAYYLKQQNAELDTYRHDVLDMDQETISEIRSYHHPHKCVHVTMMVVYMILGYPEEHLVDWTDVTALMGRYGKDSLLREVRQADTRQVSNRVALRARNYLGMYTQDDVRLVSSGAATFHVWASEKVGLKQKGHDDDRASRNNSHASRVVGSRTGKPTKTGEPDNEPLPLVNTGGKGRAPGQRNKSEPPGTPPPAPKGKAKAKKKDKNKPQGKTAQPQAKQTHQSKGKQEKQEKQEKGVEPANKERKGSKGNKVDPRDTSAKAAKSTKKG